MDVLIVLVFVSLVLVGGGVLLFLVGVHQGDFEHADRLALLPLLDSSVTRAASEEAVLPAPPAEAIAAPPAARGPDATDPSPFPSSISQPSSS